jgi:hypothetical protein
VEKRQIYRWQEFDDSEIPPVLMPKLMQKRHNRESNRDLVWNAATVLNIKAATHVQKQRRQGKQSSLGNAANEQYTSSSSSSSLLQRHRRSISCLRRCLKRAELHPAQCHQLC